MDEMRTPFVEAPLINARAESPRADRGEARRSYERYGFLHFPESASPFLLPMATIGQPFV
jgi:hypothetical protein